MVLGTVVVSSDAPVAAVGLKFDEETANVGERKNEFTAAPVIQIE